MDVRSGRASRTRNDPLVVGIPRQRMVGTQSVLEIPLITGQSIIDDGDLGRFGLGEV